MALLRFDCGVCLGCRLCDDAGRSLEVRARGVLATGCQAFVLLVMVTAHTYHLKVVLLEIHSLLIAPDLSLENPGATRWLLLLLY